MSEEWSQREENPIKTITIMLGLICLFRRRLVKRSLFFCFCLFEGGYLIFNKNIFNTIFYECLCFSLFLVNHANGNREVFLMLSLTNLEKDTAVHCGDWVI